MEPGDAKTGHSKMFVEDDVPRLWAKPAPSFFARKFRPTPQIDKVLTERIAAASRAVAKNAGFATRTAVRD
jgi:hypothetical protein